MTFRNSFKRTATFAAEMLAKFEYIDLGYIYNRHFGILQYRNNTVSGESFVINSVLPEIFGIKADLTFFDVGINEGGYSGEFVTHFPYATVYGFEPNPHTYSRAAARFSNNPAVSVVHAALSDHSGKIDLFDYEGGEGSGHASVYEDVLREQHHAKAADKYRIDCTTLDIFAASHNINHIDFVKIDTEGHELSVLRGARTLISNNCIDAIQFEFNEMNVISRTFLKDFYDILPAFDFYRLHSRGLLPLHAYSPRHEIFQFHNILALPKSKRSAVAKFSVRNA